jgi:hypothetical protein
MERLVASPKLVRGCPYGRCSPSGPQIPNPFSGFGNRQERQGPEDFQDLKAGWIYAGCTVSNKNEDSIETTPFAFFNAVLRSARFA